MIQRFRQTRVWQKIIVQLLPVFRSRIGVIFFLGCVIYAIGAAVRAGVPGMIFDTLRDTLELSASQTSMISSWGVGGCIVFIAFAGILTDRWGWKIMLPLGGILQILGGYWVYSSSELWIIYAGSFLNGGGRTIGYLALLKFLDAEFNRKYFSILIGLFYLFSYGGTYLGTEPFAELAENYPWNRILEMANCITLGCLVGILVLLPREKEVVMVSGKRSVDSGFLKELGNALLKKPAMACIVGTAVAIAVYWSLLAGAAAKYLQECCQVDPADVLGWMNLVVLLEMIVGGTVSFCCGQRRLIFQRGALLLIALGIGCCLIGIPLGTEQASVFGVIGILAIGAGYGFTCVQITAIREVLPIRFAASGIALCNFLANILMIGLTQLTGELFDRFGNEDLTIQSAGYCLLFSVYLLLGLSALFCSVFYRETRGENISGIL